jgi:hypothetical protein
MKKYLVRYSLPNFLELYDFVCMANSTLHAEEQCKKAYPDSIIHDISTSDF